MIYHIKEDQEPVFPMEDGTDLVLPHSTLSFKIGPEITEKQQAGAICTMVEMAIQERVEQMRPQAPDADHCVLIGYNYRFEPVPPGEFNVTLTLGIGLTGHTPVLSIQHTDNLAFAAKALIVQVGHGGPEDRKFPG